MSSTVDKEKEQLTRTPSPKPADEDSTTEGSEGDQVLFEAKTLSQRKGSAMINDAEDSHSKIRLGASVKAKPATELTSEHDGINDEGTLSRNSAGEVKRREKAVSASPDHVIEERYGTRSASKPKAKLGKIGGKNKVLDDTIPPHSQPVQENQNPHRESLNNVSADTEISSSRGPTATVTLRTGRATIQTGSTSPRETSRERANRKRAVLKRDLEEKSKSTVKKKRKF